MLQLYSYWRSSSSYRVRIALNLKLIDYQILPVHLLRDGGEQHRPAYRALNPQEMVPLLIDGDFRLSQSLAIFQYLESCVPLPALIPEDVQMAALMWSFCQAIACDIQPLQNTRVLNYLGQQWAIDEAARKRWIQHWIGTGLSTLEQTLVTGTETDTAFSFGDTPTYADCCLMPQLYSAVRFGCELADWPRLQAIHARCAEHPAFFEAHPDQQIDRPPAG